MSDSSKNEVGPKGQMIMGIVFMVGSLGVILIAWYSMLGSFKEREAVDWPKVQGVVLESGTRKFRDSAGHGRNWVPHVKYRYQVDDQRHIGENYRFLPITYEGMYKKRAEELGSKYKPKGPLMVRVNPEDSSESVIVALKPRGEGSSYIGIGFGCFGLLVGGALGWGGFKGMRAAA